MKMDATHVLENIYFLRTLVIQQNAKMDIMKQEEFVILVTQSVIYVLILQDIVLVV
jgi:hypothetical protein